jgi:hypothetical protein
VGGAPVGEKLAPGDWVDLQSSGTVVVKQQIRGRELRFTGAGRARPCSWGEPEVWITRGMVEATGAAGEAPGSEEWVVTPYGVVHYASAEFELVVDPEGMNLRMKRGTAYVDLTVEAPVRAVGVWPEATATKMMADAAALRLPEGAYRVDAPKAFGFRFNLDASTPLPSVQTAVDACKAHASAAHTLAESLHGHSGEPQFGELAARHVDARRSARMFCAVASLRVNGGARAGEGPRDAAPVEDALTRELEAADRSWR